MGRKWSRVGRTTCVLHLRDTKAHLYWFRSPFGALALSISAATLTSQVTAPINSRRSDELSYEKHKLCIYQIFLLTQNQRVLFRSQDLNSLPYATVHMQVQGVILWRTLVEKSYIYIHALNQLLEGN